MTQQCPVCRAADCRASETAGSRKRYQCGNCGLFEVTNSVLPALSTEEFDDVRRAILSHAVYRMQRESSPPLLNRSLLEAVLSNAALPSPAEQTAKAILWFGHTSRDPAEFAEVRTREFPAKVGAVGVQGAYYILRAVHEEGLLGVWEWDSEAVGRTPHLTTRGILRCRLTLRGWSEFEALTLGTAETRAAFMAMPFSGKWGVAVRPVYERFREAAAETGFELSNRLLEEPRAGLIDDHLRVEVRVSRFLVVDLTGGNLGAYWEAGFAEGLGKPVIYACEKGFFDGGRGTHFDTGHLQTVVWDPEDLDPAANHLKAIIRNTFPSEAILVDRT